MSCRGGENLIHPKVKTTLSTLVLVMVGAAALPAHVAGDDLPTQTLLADTALAANFRGHIAIGADDITLDCAGFAVVGTGEGIGILLLGRTGITVRNCVVTGFVLGIALTASHSNTLASNVAYGNGFGFQLLRSPDNVLARNTANGNDNGFGLFESNGNSITSNTANGNRVFNGFQLWSSSANVFTMNTATGNPSSGFVIIGIVAASTGNIFTKNTADANGLYGFNLGPDFDGNLLMRNRANANGRYGFVLTSADDNSLIANEACGNGVLDAFQSGGTGNVFRANRFCLTLGI